MLGLRWGIDRGRQAEPAALLACIVFALLALWLLVRLVWLLLPRGDAAFDTAPMRVGADSAGPVPATSIAKWHLFGNSPLVRGNGGTAPATTLSLILRGTFAGADPKSGIAVIADAGNGERAYRVGEEVAAGARLAAVYADHIVLDHEGAEETLVLPRDRNLAPTDIVQPTPATASSRPGNRPAATTTHSPGAPASAPPALRQTLARLRQDPQELARRVQVVPVLDGGKLTGVRLSAGTDVALMQQIGLRPGDVVTRVNGLPIDSLARGQEIMSSLKNSTAVRVTVLRDGKSTDLDVGLQ